VKPGQHYVRAVSWNIQKRPLAAHIAGLAADHRADLVILTEHESPDADVIQALNAVPDRPTFHRVPAGPSRAAVFTCLPSKTVKAVLGGNPYVTIVSIQPPKSAELLLCCVHLPSKTNLSEDEQYEAAIETVRLIRQVETERGHARTVVAGDFNMDPFEKGMITFNAFDAVPTRADARPTRTVRATDYGMFYNPMFAHLGDHPSRPPGTWYGDLGGGNPALAWRCFDQVLVRPDLLPWFDADAIVVPRTAGALSLVDAHGRPDPTHASDHLPLVFRVGIPEASGESHA
jgi:endonuclease/exonuclease/phosphatase family metal-dependent hydrolase